MMKRITFGIAGVEEIPPAGAFDPHVIYTLGNVDHGVVGEHQARSSRVSTRPCG